MYAGSDSERQKMKKLTLILVACGLASCSSTPPPVEEKETPQEVAPPPPPQCLPNCEINIEDACVSEANVIDGARTTTQEVDCDPRCCEARFQEANEIDADGDGIPDERDQCPDQPEDLDGFEDEDGCPDPDNDGDGILDVNDLCMLDPEDKDGDQDNDGCPE